MRCIACEGTGQSSRGAPCEPCKGTGQRKAAADSCLIDEVDELRARCESLEQEHARLKIALRWMFSNHFAAHPQRLAVPAEVAGVVDSGQWTVDGQEKKNPEAVCRLTNPEPPAAVKPAVSPPASSPSTVHRQPSTTLAPVTPPTASPFSEGLLFDLDNPNEDRCAEIDEPYVSQR